MQQFIGREDWLNRFKDYLSQEKGVVWRITGQPGIGKSTLLRRFELHCEDAEHPVTWLDMEGFTPAHGLEVLTEMVRAARFFNAETVGKTKREKAGEATVWLKDKLGGVMDVGKLLDPTGGLIVGGAKVLFDLGMGLAGGAAQMSESAAAAYPELFLLEALVKAGEKRPVCLIDTYEHILRNDLKIQSRLLGDGRAREGSIKTQPLSEWLHKLFEYLQVNGWRIVMTGREVPLSKSDDQLPRFSRDEILQAARIRPALAEYLPTQESAIAAVLSTLSFEGNPLWLQVAMNLLENLLAEGKDLAQLAQQPEYLHECFETDDPFDTGAYNGIEHGRCKLTLINTLTRHIGDLEDQAWKIALPRVLDKGIVMQLFAQQQATAILHNFKLAGVFRVTGQQFTLHEEIRDLLLAYARSKGWLDTDETRALHGNLWDYISQRYSPQSKLEEVLSGHEITGGNFSEVRSQHSEVEMVFPRIWILEASYHRCLSGIGLTEKGISPRSFAYALMGSASLTAVEKWQIANRLPSLSAFQVSEFMRIIDEETQKWEGVFGREVTTRLLLDIAEGKVGYIGTDVAYWEQQVRLHGLYGDFYGLYSALNETGANSGRLVEVIDEMLHRYGDSAHAGVQEQCAKALFNKGWTLDEKLNDPLGAVAVYDQLLHRYGDSALPAVQEQCAKALFNKGWTLGEKLNDPQGAVVVYDSLLHRYGDSALPAVQEQCAKALVNKGWTLGEKLNDPQGAVVVYDSLVHRYGDSAHAGVQERCANALVNKGWTLANKLNDPQGAVTVYDMLHRYGDSALPAVQEQCATALVKKGVTLGRLDDFAGAIACYDDLLARYSQSENPAIQAQCQSAEENTAELLLVLGRNAEAIPRIRQVLARTDAANQKSAIMHFLLWLAAADTTQDDVLAAIRALSAEVEFSWGWGDIRPLVDKLPEPRKTQAECFIAFFEQHHDIAQLESCLCLANREINRSS